ncbi:sugar phosphate isomerase/epimerase family protein [Gorillibacterium sp. sgz5001074]|uniref:sugar phosphate isomerase/epimerase family protein n=1 Tax=Gorillibacterium sp. sgz5001074 TaxID=3446695 RepID=UPI003F6678A9
MTKAHVGIQLYTLRELTKTDFLGTIRKVADMGYEAVEFAGYFGVPARELRAFVADCGLKAPSSHVGLDFSDLTKMETALAQQIEYAQELGLEYLVTPSSPFSEVPTQEELDHVIAFLERAARMVREAGLKYGYHNHAFEFKQVNGKAIMDHMLERIPAELMFAEFDLGWVHKGGCKPAEYISRYAGRVPLAHIKDFGESTSDTEIGRGVVDFESVFGIAEQAGIRYYIVEQEQFQGSPLDSARISLEYFKARGLLD